MNAPFLAAGMLPELPDFVVEQIVRGVLWPIGAGLLVAALAWGVLRFSRPGSPATLGDGRGWGALLIGAAFLSGYLGLMKWPPFPPVGGARNWLPFLVVAFVLSAVLLESWLRPRSVWLPRLALLIPALNVLLAARLGTLGPDSAAPALLGLAIIALGGWFGAEKSQERVAPWAGAAWMGAWFGSLAAILLLTHSAILAQLGGMAASGVAGLFLLCWLRPKSAGLLPGAWSVVWPLTFALSLIGVLYSETKISALLPLALSPAGFWTADLPLLAARPAWQRHAAGLFIALAFVALALVIAVIQSDVLHPKAPTGY